MKERQTTAINDRKATRFEQKIPFACRGEAEGEDGRSSRLRGSIFSFLTARVAQDAKKDQKE